MEGAIEGGLILKGSHLKFAICSAFYIQGAEGIEDVQRNVFDLKFKGFFRIRADFSLQT